MSKLFSSILLVSAERRIFKDGNVVCNRDIKLPAVSCAV